ncbi:Ubiquitin carboxyl-terminal hydrolase 35 [Mortierella alpina]|nr:Ubiquitin carboxyl-terminal hydrolase 35 [Mortierella alpina]
MISLLHSFAALPAFLMETIIKGVLAQSTLQDKVKSTFIAKLLKQVASQSKADAAILLDFALELKLSAKNPLENQTGDRIFLAVSVAHRNVFWTRFHSDWLEATTSVTTTDQDFIKNIPLMIAVVKRKQALTDDEKQEIERDMEILRHFAEKSCIFAEEPPTLTMQCLCVSMYISLPDTRPLAMASYIEFLVEHLANIPAPVSSSPREAFLMAKGAISLLEQCWTNGPDNVFMTIPQLFLRLSDDQRECSLGVGYLLQAIPNIHTSVVDPFIQGLDVAVLWRLEFTVQRLINWLVTTDIAGIGMWIVAIMESLASRGEFVLLRKLADENAYKIARQLAFRPRRDDAFLVLKFLLTGYHHSPILFHNISKDLLPLLVSCRKSPPIVTRAEALQTMQDYSWKKGLQIQGTAAGSRRKPAFVQPLGKVGLVNLGNSCFMNSALRALFCSSELRRAVLVDTQGVDPKKIMTLSLRETFIGLSTSRLSIFTPLMLYKALPEWLNDGHQQDAAEFTHRMEDEDPVSKRALSSFHGAIINQIKCSVCGTVSSNKEDFYHLSLPLSRSESADIQDLVDIFPSVEDLNDENGNKYFCDKCGVLQNAKRIALREMIYIKVQDSLDSQAYQLYAVVIHTGESAHHGHYFTYARDDDTLAVGTHGLDPASTTQWLLYNDTSITVSSFETMQQELANTRTDTPYMLYFRRTSTAPKQKKSNADLSKMTVSNL